METSADAQNWHHDARYFYYPHGPLQRVELGEHLVQGTDYAYTLQGWLKGINGDRLNPTTDMGRDGDATVVGNPNLLTGRDAYALSLGYYGDNDYKAIASSYDSDSPANIAQRPFAPIGSGGTMNTEHTPLYNGNIAHTVNTLQHFGLWDATNGDQGQVLAMVYRYDQLNRLRTARGLVGLGNTNTWNGVNDAATNRYRSEYTYDANGNIETVERYDADGTGHYDSFAYHYHTNGGRKQQNRLYLLIDDATMNTGSDIVTTATGFDNTSNGVNVNNNYSYDALGNLIRDAREQIGAIEWTVAGKVKSVSRTLGSTRDPLSFGYGASGQRILKQVGTNPDGGNGYREHYIRDAQGNIMATYRYTNTGTASLKLNERPVYGSSRLGSLRKEVELHTLPSFDPASANPGQQVDLNYELTDHLGNVCAVVTGRLLDGNGGGTAKQSELVSAQGYEPFGSLLPGRSYSTTADTYRFGFQGQESDGEINGERNSYAFEYRMHDPRVGRFLSIDPLAVKFAWNSPYAFSENRVIDAFEFEGLEATLVRIPLGWMTPNGPVFFPPHIKLTVAADVKNKSATMTAQVMAQVLERAAKILENAMTRNNNPNASSVETKTQFTEGDASKGWQVSFVDVVRNPYTGEPTDYVGLTDWGIGATQRNHFQIKYRGDSEEDIDAMARTLAHELGHGMGLAHPDHDDARIDESTGKECFTCPTSPIDERGNENNLMRQSWRTTGVEIHSKQLDRIIEEIIQDGGIITTPK